jgi:hypothetical protein
LLALISVGLIVQDPDYLGREYPDMAYWRGCRIVEDGLRLKRPLIIDYPGTTYYIPSKPNIPRLTMANMAGGAPIPLDSSGHITSKLPRVFVEFTIVIKEGADSSATPAAGQQEYVLVVEVLPDWSPLGASRLVELVSTGYFTNMVFFRVLKVSCKAAAVFARHACSLITLLPYPTLEFHGPVWYLVDPPRRDKTLPGQANS